MKLRNRILTSVPLLMLLVTPGAFAAWNSFLNNGDPLPPLRWNEMVGKVVEVNNLKETLSTALTDFEDRIVSISNMLGTHTARLTTIGTSLNGVISDVNTLTGKINTLSGNLIALESTLNTKLKQTVADGKFVLLSGSTITGALSAPEFNFKNNDTNSIGEYGLVGIGGNPVFFSQNSKINFGNTGSVDELSIGPSTTNLSGTVLKISNSDDLAFSNDNRIGNSFSDGGLNIQGSSSKINFNGNLTINSYSGTSPNVYVGGKTSVDALRFSGNESTKVITDLDGSVKFDIGSSNSGSGFYLIPETGSDPAFSILGNGKSIFGFTGSNVTFDNPTNATSLLLTKGKDKFSLLNSLGSSNSVGGIGLGISMETTEAGNGNQCTGFSCVNPISFTSFSGETFAPKAEFNSNVEVKGDMIVLKKSIFEDSITLARLGSDPILGFSGGSIYYNNVSNKIRQYANGSWSDFGSSSSVPTNFVQKSGTAANTIINDGGFGCIGGGCVFNGKGRNGDGTTADTPGISCLTIKNKFPESTDGQYRIEPVGIGSPFQVFCDMTTDGGGYTMYPVTGGIATNSVSSWDSCKEKGLHMFVPRTQAHLNKALSLYNSRIIGKTVGVYGDAAGNYNGRIMRSINEAVNGNWHSVGTYDGQWFMRAVSYTEPSGDYTAGCWLSVSSSDGNGLIFNDATCPAAVTQYLCSAYDK